VSATSVWVIGTNLVAAVLCFWIAGDSALDDPWFYIGVSVIACLAFGILLELRGSRWRSRWNVSLFALVGLATVVTATVAPAHAPAHDEGSGLLVMFFGIPALFLAAVDFFAYRRERRTEAA
jgi:peptidoglycan/LPS O-acetylase OafA/YrhL